jgi:D-sedoheptulose 7-phosphate isomerase
MGTSMDHIIARALKENLRIKENFIKKNTSKLIEVAHYLSNVFRNDGKLMICGNGGSAADSQHIAAEFVNKFQLDRPPLPALALTTDTSILTSVAND